MTPIDAQLLDFAAALGVSIEYTADIREDRDGEYIHRRKLIRLRPAMHGRKHRCVFAHEIGHAVFGDTPSRFGPVAAKQERRAEAWAALRLINVHEYRHSEQARHGHLGAMALDLDVMVSTVRAFQGLILRVGDTAYVGPRIGAGQWLHRLDASAGGSETR
jgi:isoaspartyl peptidase/L-asparaginase-like protein (Ntn-hydrolase superfamily)